MFQCKYYLDVTKLIFSFVLLLLPSVCVVCVCNNATSTEEAEAAQ